MIKKISAVEARKHFGELLNRVLLMDDEIIIEKAGKKLAKLVRPNSKEKNNGEGKLDFRKAAGLGSEIWRKINVEEYIKGECASWE
jgi:antitoxin (DNA-binding transcriptional repressor) of toxin-antitoxin stability system